MNSTRTIGGHFSPEAVEVNYAVTTLLESWEIEQKWTKIRGVRALTYRLRVRWNGKQGLMTGVFELPDELHTILAPSFSGLKISMSRERRLPIEHDFCWDVSLYITWRKRYTSTKHGTLTIERKEETIWKDSVGKLFYTLDGASPSFFRNCYIQKFEDKLIMSETYKDGITAEDV